MPIKSFNRFVEGVSEPQVLGSFRSTGTGLFMDSSHSQFPHLAQAVFERGFCDFQVVVRLQIHPVSRALPKSLAQPQSHFSRHRALPAHQMRNARAGNSQGSCQRSLCHTQTFQSFTNVFAGVNRWQAAECGFHGTERSQFVEYQQEESVVT